MPDIIPNHVPSPRTALAWDKTAYRPVLIDAAGRVQVRGENQLFSYKDSIIDKSAGVPSGASGYRLSTAVPAGVVWVITQLCAYDDTTANTQHNYFISRGGVDSDIFEVKAALAGGQRTALSTHLYLITGDQVKVYYIGALVGDTCVLVLHGYSMTKEV